MAAYAWEQAETVGAPCRPLVLVLLGMLTEKLSEHACGPRRASRLAHAAPISLLCTEGFLVQQSAFRKGITGKWWG